MLNISSLKTESPNLVIFFQFAEMQKAYKISVPLHTDQNFRQVGKYASFISLREEAIKFTINHFIRIRSRYHKVSSTLKYEKQ